MKKSFALALIIFCFYGCRDKIMEPMNTVKPEPVSGFINYQYVPGEVETYFIDTLNYNFIRSFINGLNVGVISIDADSAFEMQIHIDSGSVSNYIEIFSNDSAVVWASQGSSYPPESPPNPFIMVRFKGSYSVQYAFDLIRSFHGLSWIKTWYSAKNAYLRVPKGQEQHWIDSLNTYPFITGTQLVHITVAHPG